MKKKVVFLFILLSFLAAFFYLKYKFIPLTMYLIQKFTGIKIACSRVDFDFRPWILNLRLDEAKILGPVSGHAGSIFASIDLKKRILLTQLKISKFSIHLPSGEKGLSFPPIEYLQATDGKLIVENTAISVKKLELRNLIPGRVFALFAELVYPPYFEYGLIKMGGRYGESEGPFSGIYEIKGFYLPSIISHSDGTLDLKGSFTYKNGRIKADGKFKTASLLFYGNIFKKPYKLTDASGLLSIRGSISDFSITTSILNSDGIALEILFNFSSGKLTGLKLKTNKMEIEVIKEHLHTENLVGFDPLMFVRGGKIKIEDLVYTETPPSFSTKLFLSQASLFVSGYSFEEMEGEIVMDTKRLYILDAKAKYRSSFIERVNGEISLTQRPTINLEGSFLCDLSDISEFIKYDKVSIFGGSARGHAKIRWDETHGLKYEGEAEIRNANGEFYGTQSDFSGKILFSDEKLFLDPLFFYDGGTALFVKGSLDKNGAKLSFDGKISSLSLDRLKGSTFFDFDGTASVSFMLESSKEKLFLSGGFDLTGFTISIPQVFFKEEGINCEMILDLEKTENLVVVKKTDFKLGSMNIKGSGKKDQKSMDFDISVEIGNIAEVAPYFFLGEFSEEGYLRAEISAKGVLPSFEKLPSLKGYVEIKNGLLRLPHLIYPVRNLDLRADLKGESIQMEVFGAKIGHSELKSATINVEGIDNPLLVGFVNFDTICTCDFRTEEEISFPFLEEGLPKKSRISLDIFAKNASHGNLLINGLKLNIQKEGAHISINGVAANLLGGDMRFEGSLSLVRPKPEFQSEIKSIGIDLKEVSSSILKKENLLEGKAALTAKLKAKGKTLNEMGKNLSGEFQFMARKGTIRKWNFLAKILELLNVYRLAQLKLDLQKEGLSYDRMGGTFFLAGSVLQTENFVIDSPSMIIAGKGEIDVKRDYMDGKVSVFPLVALEKTIDKIPILRRILRGKERGFLSVNYTVEGRIMDPEVKIDVVKTLPGKVFDVMKNLLTIPAFPWEVLELDKGK